MSVNPDLFIARLAEALQTEPGQPLAASTPLAGLASFDSMGKINVSLLIEELFGFQIDYDVLESVATVGALYERCATAQPA